jgi:hypothetical protein
VKLRFIRNVLFKAILLLVVSNVVFAFLDPYTLGRITLYNRIYPGRSRLPFGENASQAYNFSLFNLDAMFSSHVIDRGPKPENEYRIITIGDSSVWGTLLQPNETLAGQINASALTICGKQVQAYNLGYPTISVTKDLLILDRAMRYQPDMVIWLVTLEALPKDKQLTSPLVANNPSIVKDLIKKYDLSFNPQDPAIVQQSLWDKTIIGRRRSLADLFRLQIYGVMWAATGIDQVYPQEYTPAQTDLADDLTFHDWSPPLLSSENLSYEILKAGMQAVGNVPLIIINEPILISAGANNDIRYNFFYPRWAYDQYRLQMADLSWTTGWQYIDLWEILPDSSDYTNSAIHLTPEGEGILTQHITDQIISPKCP